MVVGMIGGGLIEMVACKDCKKEMQDKSTESCTYDMIKINGIWMKRWANWFDGNKRCHDCNIVNTMGNLHHFGCDMERCPNCQQQLIVCKCTVEMLGKSAATNKKKIGNRVKL